MTKLPRVEVDTVYVAGHHEAKVVYLYPETEDGLAEKVFLYNALDERDAYMFRAQLLVGYGRLPVDKG